MSNELQQVLDELRKPFHPSQITWKPGSVKGDRALALAYADLRAYMNRLDEVCGADWSVSYEPWGEDRIICRMTIMGVMRSSTGETNNESERSEIGGTVAEAQAFKRAAAMFGLGRYLYNLPTGWADFDPATKRFTEKAKARLMGILVQHYRRATDDQSDLAAISSGDSGADGDGGEPTPAEAQDNAGKQTAKPAIPAELMRQFNALGNDLYGDQWEQVCQRNVTRITGGKAQDSGELTPDQIQQLVTGMIKLKSKRTPTGEMATA